MSVAVAHQITTTSRVALREAAREAGFRETDLAVIHVAESLDEDVTDAFHAGVSDEIERALGSTDLGDLNGRCTWHRGDPTWPGSSSRWPRGRVRRCWSSVVGAVRRSARPCWAASPRRSFWGRRVPSSW